MNPDLLYAFAGAGLVMMGLLALMVVPHLLRKILAFNVIASGVLLILVGLGQEQGNVDPIPQALVLTGIVVAFASTALAVVLLRRWYRATGTTALEEDQGAEEPSAREREKN